MLGTNQYEGVSLKPCDDHSLNKSKDHLIDLLSKTMENRFGDVNQGILRAMRITNFQYWPEADRNADFGDADVQELITHFVPVLLRSGVKVGEVLDQWTVLKSRLYQDSSVLQNISWPEVNRQLSQDCPDILHLVDLILCIPASTADCERGFSAMKHVKSDWRASLRSQTLSDLLTVQLSSASIADFDPASAINLWHVGGIRSRRPAFMEQRRDESDDESSDDI